LTTSVTTVDLFRLPETPQIVMVYVPAGVFLTPCCPLLVLICRVEDADVAPGTTDPGVNVQTAESGNPEQLRATELL
jgi:hypothetical protein